MAFNNFGGQRQQDKNKSGVEQKEKLSYSQDLKEETSREKESR